MSLKAVRKGSVHNILPGRNVCGQIKAQKYIRNGVVEGVGSDKLVGGLLINIEQLTTMLCTALLGISKVDQLGVSIEALILV